MADGAKHLEALAEEIFDLTTLSWRTRRRAKEGPDLSESEFLALDLLAKHEPRTVGEIQKQIGVLPAQMSRVIRALESKSGRPFIACSINPVDKRRIDVCLTDAGRKVHAAYRSARLAQTVGMLATLREKDRTEFMRILRVLREKLSNQLKAQ